MRVLVSTIGSRGDVQPLVAQPLVTPSGLTWLPAPGRSPEWYEATARWSQRDE